MLMRKWEGVGTLLLAKQREISSKLCFDSTDEKISGEKEEVCAKIHQLFFSVHEIDHPSNISINRTVGQLAENSGVKKLFKELK